LEKGVEAPGFRRHLSELAERSIFMLQPGKMEGRP
jgi:hypothetical protein